MKVFTPSRTIFAGIVILACFLASCNTAKKASVSCPEYSVHKKNIAAVKYKRKKNRAIHYEAKTNINHESKANQKEDKIPAKNFPTQDDLIVTGMNNQEIPSELVASFDNSTIQFVEKTVETYPYTKPENHEITRESAKTQAIGCDTIVFKTGGRLVAKVEEIGPNEIKYRKCDNLTGPLISISKLDVFKVHYSNGTSDYIQRLAGNSQAKTEGLGIAGFVAGIVGLFVAGIPLGLLAIIFGFVSLSKIKKQPDRFKGKGFAIASIVIGMVAVVGAIIFLASV